LVNGVSKSSLPVFKKKSRARTKASAWHLQRYV
jgi:hypothetical protein